MPSASSPGADAGRITSVAPKRRASAAISAVGVPASTGIRATPRQRQASQSGDRGRPIADRRDDEVVAARDRAETKRFELCRCCRDAFQMSSAERLAPADGT